MTSGGVKRPLFSKSAWIAPPAANSPLATDGGSIFGRNVDYEDIVRAERAERERKAAKTKARGGGKEKSDDRHDLKRRRLSPGEERDVESASGSEAEHSRKKKKEEDGVREKPVTRSTPMKRKGLSDGLDASTRTRQSPRGKADVKNTTITLDGGDEEETEDDDLVMSPRKSKADEVLDERDSEEEDEYLRLLKQKAREKARLQRQDGQTVQRSSTPPDRGSSIALETADPRSPSVVRAQRDSRPASSNSIQDFGVASARRTPNPDQENDPEVKILIQSDIPGAKSLIVRRKASQSLKQVKEFWCRKFDLEESVTRQVFFTWKGTRLFDSTTMRGIIRGLKKDYHRQQQRPRSLSLGIEDGDEDGGGGGDDDGYDSSSTKDPSGGNIMLEAMTPEIYEQRLRDKERRQQRQRPQISSTAAADGEDEDGDPEEQEDEDAANAAAAASETPAAAAAAAERDKGAIVIRLVSKDLEPMQLRVRPHTTIGKIMRGYAATRKVDEAKTPWLIFDGERLDAESTVEEVGFEDEDEVEVSIR
ncbi:uncharacterized protein PV07_09299 [Cladophialophora immunda]|uniref:Ubiquitin-like domain-containing protein n=1 Tax=Cladophialophora immunda TaxID=569365 RepID=A0A0D2C6P6_9EURO|nr:uncharacterized protein PV07_09299 [Cladophialophora immunda]KIW26185.1 hypothetical protein PV07_09299 [Cladophialophora immunda]